MTIDTLDDLVEKLGKSKVDALFLEYFLRLVAEGNAVTELRNYMNDVAEIKKEEAIRLLQAKPLNEEDYLL